MNRLTPLKKSLAKKPLWGFDIETYGNKNKFLMGSIVGDNLVKKVFWDKDDFVSYLDDNILFFSKGSIFATNLMFDSMALYYESKEYENIHPIIKNGRMIFLSIEKEINNQKRRLKFYDTMSFSPMSVKNWGKILGIDKLRKPLCLGKHPENERQKAYLEKYNLNDSMITYKAACFLQDNFYSFGSSLKMTIASSAMDLFRRKYLKDSYWQPKEEYLLEIYKAYSGGRTEAIKRGIANNINFYDVKSMYPSVMCNDFPDPNHMKYDKINMKTIFDYEGVCEAYILAPYEYIPYLQYRAKDKLLYPYGNFKGFYTFFELREASKLGYRLKLGEKGFIYFDLCRPFKDYVIDLYRMKQEYEKVDSPLKLIPKIFLNSLYGKFAQKIESKEILIHKTKMSKKLYDSTDDINECGDFMSLKVKYDHIPSFINPIFSIYVTAYARHKLYSLIMKNTKKFFYCDTDSLMTKAEYDTGNNLGDLALQQKIRNCIIVKPKMYKADSYVKCKGLNVSVDMFLMALDKKEIKRIKFVKFKEANRRHLFYNEKIELKKIFNLEDDKRVWDSGFNPDILQDSEPLKIYRKV